MSDTLEIRPAKGPVTGTPRLPGSKSLTNRTLLLAALASGTSALEGVLISDDTLRMVDCLQRLGIPITVDAERARMTVTGCSGTFPASCAELYAGDAGTVARFLAAALPLGRGSYSLDGSSRMRRRPIQPLIHALRALGVDVQANQGFLPLRIRAEGLKGGRIEQPVPERTSDGVSPRPVGGCAGRSRPRGIRALYRHDHPHHARMGSARRDV